VDSEKAGLPAQKKRRDSFFRQKKSQERKDGQAASFPPTLDTVTSPVLSNCCLQA